MRTPRPFAANQTIFNPIGKGIAAMNALTFARQRLLLTSALVAGAAAVSPLAGGIAFAQTETTAGDVDGTTPNGGPTSPDINDVLGGVQVDLRTQKSVINWKHFNIVDPARTINFSDLSGLPAGTIVSVLNRVVGNGVDPIEASVINGLISSSSNVVVWISNPMGITFGSSGVFSGGSLVLTTAAISDAGNENDFRGGDDDYSLTGATANAITLSAGSQITASGRFVAMSQNINNSATIAAGEDVALIAAQDIDLTLSPGSPISFTIKAGTTVGSAKLNSDGTINASSITLTGAGRRTAGSESDLLLEISGTLTATAVGGKVFLGLQRDAGDDTIGGANDAMRLIGDTTLIGTDVEIASALDSDATARALDVQGNARFGGALGATSALSSLAVSGTTELDAASVTTTGAQTYTGAVTLKQDAALSGDGIQFGSTVQSDTDGAAGLVVTATSSRTSFAGAIGGGGKALKSLTTNGLAEIAGGSVVTKDGQSYNGAVVLAADTTLTSNDGGAIGFASTVDSDAGQIRSLTTSSTGLTTFGGRVGATDKLSTLTVNGLSALNVAGTLGAPSIQTTGAQTYTGAVTLGADTVLSGTSATFGSTVNGARSLDVLGNAVFKGVVGGLSALTGLTVSGTTEFDGGSVTTSGAQTYTGAVTLKQDAALTGTDITFASTVQSDVDGAAGLTATATSGKTLFTGAVGGGGKALKSLTTNGNAEIAGGSVITKNDQLYNGAVVLTADTTLTSNDGGAIGFGSTVDSGAGTTRALTTATTGLTTFGGRVGATDKLSTLTVNGASALNVAGTLGAPSIQTTGAQTYTGAVTLGANTVLGGTSATFGSTVNGARSLDVLGNAVFKGVVGGLTGLTVSGATEFDGGSVTTSGAQTYTGAVTLKQDAALSGSGIAFGSTVQGDVDGAAGLTATATSGKTLFTGAVGGGGKALKFLTTNGNAEIAGGSVITKDAQAYNGAVVLSADTTLTSNNGGAIGFGSTVDSDAGQTRALTTATTGLTTFGSRVGATDKLSTLAVNGATVFDATGATTVSTTGAQTYTGAVTLKQDTSLSGTDITFASTVQSDVDGGAGLETTATGKTRFAAAVGGGGKALKFLTTNGLAEIAGGSVITKNAQTYNGAVVLTADTTLTSNDGGAIGFGSTVDSDAGQTRALTTATTGVTTFGGKVGSTDKLSTLLANGGTVFDATGATTVSTTGAQTYTGAVTLKKDTTLSGTDIIFASTVRSDVAGGAALETTASGKTRFVGAVGDAGKALKSLTANGLTEIVGGTVITTQHQLYDGAVILAADTELLSSNLGTISFTSTVDSAAGQNRSLRTSSGGMTFFNGRVGATDKLSTLQVDGTSMLSVAGTLLAPSIQTTGRQTYVRAVTLNADTVLSGTTVTFGGAPGGTVNGAHSLDVLGNAVFKGVVGGSTALTGLTVSGTTEFDGGSVTTSGAQTYTGAVTLKQDAALSGADITFASTVQSDADGGAGLTATATATATGKTRFAAAVGGGGKALKFLTTNGLSEIAGGSVVTKNDQRYNGAVVLAADTTLTSTDGGLIGFASTVDSDTGQTRSLTTTSTGQTTFGGRVGATDKLSTLTVNGPSALNAAGTLLAPSIQTTGAQTYNGAVTLGADTVLSGTTMTFGTGGTINGARSLDVLGNAVFKGVVGGSTALTRLTVSGTTEFDAAGATTVTTTGQQTYTGAVTLKQDTGLKGSKVTFESTVKGTQALGIDGDALFKGVVGGNGTAGEVLSALSVTGKSEFDVAGAAMAPVSATVTTTGEQTYGGAVTLAQDAVFKGSKVTFASLVDGLSAGAQRLGVLGDAVFSGNVGSANQLRSVEVIAPTAITATGSINAVEAITLDAGGAIALVDLSTSDLTPGSGNILINQNGGSGPVAVAGNVVATGDYLVTGTSVVLGDAASRSQQAGRRIAVTATAGDITRGTGALTLAAGADIMVRAMSGSALLERTTANAGTDVDVAARDDATLVNASAATGFVKVQAGKVASVTGDVSAKTDYTVTGGTGVALGDSTARTQQAGGKVSITATTGNVAQGGVTPGLLTLQSDSDGTGTRAVNDALRVTAANGSVMLGNAVLTGGTLAAGVHGKQSDVFVDAAQNVTVKEAHGRSIGLRASAGALVADKLDALEDVFGKAGTIVSVTTSAIAGDDLNLTAGTGLTINQGTASGTGADGHTVDLSGAALGVIADAGTPNLSSVTLTSAAGNILATTLTAQRDVLVTATAGNATVTSASTNTAALNGRDVKVIAGGDATLDSGSAGNDILVQGGTNATLGSGSAGNDITVSAALLASVVRDVSAGRDYTVTGGTGVVLGDSTARTQKAGRAVSITATTGNVAQGGVTPGLLTLQSDSDGTGTRAVNDALRVTASNGSVALGNAVLTGGTLAGGVHGKQSDVFVDAAQNVTVKEAHGRSIGLRASAGALVADKLDAVEDVFGKAGTTVSVTTSAIAGDDLNLTAGTGLTINQGTATGTGADGHTVDLSGAALGVIADAGAPNLSNITLTSAAGNILATTLTAQRDVLVTATTGSATVTSATALTRDVKVIAGGDATLVGGSAGNDILVDAGNDATLGTGSAGNSILVKAINNANLGNGTATNAFVRVQAGKVASVTGDVSAKTDYTVTGGTGVVLGDGSARTQKAGGKVSVTATTGDVTQGTGLLTLQSDSDGTGGDALSVLATTGSVLLGNSVVQGGSGRQSDVAIDAAKNAALAQVDGRNIAVISNQIALGGAMTGATSVELTNRTSETNDTVLGGTADSDGSKYVLSATEIGRITAPSIRIITQQATGVTQNVAVGTFALKSGTNLFGIMTTGTPDTSKITLGGAITGTGFTGTLQIGGNTVAGSQSGSIVGQIDTATIDLPTGGLDMRARQITFGRSSLLTDPALLSGDAARIARDLVSNAGSALYIQGSGGAKVDAAGNFLRAKSLRVSYTNFALFQNTGTPGSPAGVILGDATQTVTQSSPTLFLDASPASTEDAFALFGTINGFTGRPAGLLPESVVGFSTGTGTGRVVLITQSNSRVNGCVIGAPDKGCLVTDVQPPALKLFDERQAQIFSTGDDDSRVLLDPLIATNNEALIGDLAVPTLNYEVPACELNAAGECDKGKK